MWRKCKAGVGSSFSSSSSLVGLGVVHERMPLRCCLQLICNHILVFFGHIFLVRVGSRDQMGDCPHSRRHPPWSSARIAASPWQQVPSKATDSDTSESAVSAVVETLTHRTTTTGCGVNRGRTAKARTHIPFGSIPCMLQ